MDARHLHFMRETIEVARAAKTRGNLPFGSLLVNFEGEVIATGENSIITTGDQIAHAEIVLLHKIAGRYSRSYLGNCTIYTSDEPCPMCTGAIFWSGIGRLVYGLSKARYYDVTGRHNAEFVFEMPSRTILEYGGRKVEVVGPLLEDEVLKLHVE